MRWLVLAIVLAAAPAAADTGKRAKDGIALEPRETIRGKDKLCCGYPLVRELDWILTFYWLGLETDYDEPEENWGRPLEAMNLYDRNGQYIGTYPERFAWRLRMEGSGVLADGRVVNTAGKCRYGYGTCFTVLDRETHPFGRGAKRRAIVPFKSVAVDPRFIPFGEPLFIPEFEGLLLPDGTVHDGCVRADDSGGNIKEQQIDFFVLTEDYYRELLLDGLWGKDRITPTIEDPRCDYLREPWPTER